jgi:hypothetical protein
MLANDIDAKPLLCTVSFAKYFSFLANESTRTSHVLFWCDVTTATAALRGPKNVFFADVALSSSQNCPGTWRFFWEMAFPKETS